jgi:exopolysaccharide biosynthesis polyprenyl glycosylphosphotransferase
MGVISYNFVSQGPILPARIIALYGLVIAFILLIAERSILRRVRKLMRRYGWGIINTLLIGDGMSSKELIRALNNPIDSGYRVVGLVSSKTPPSIFKGKHFTSLEQGLASIQKLSVHSIVLTELYNDPLKNSLVFSTAQAQHCGFKFVPTQEGLLSGTMEVELFQGMPVVTIHQTSLMGWGRIVKRLFDIVFASLTLIILSPLLLLISIAIKLSDFGPVIFKQNRLTRYNNTINIFKFRSLKKSVNGLLPEEAFAKLGKPALAKKFRNDGDRLENDPRVTAIGKILRKYSLDELPQLINVVRGDISLVGPRALVHRELDNYPYKSLILSVKSGITGIAQISGRRNIPFEERRKLDLYYVQNWSFWLDIKILVRTVLELINGTGDES